MTTPRELRLTTATDHDADPSDHDLALARFLLAAGRGGTECAIAGCHDQATVFRPVLGVMRHVCDRHDGGFDDDDDDET